MPKASSKQLNPTKVIGGELLPPFSNFLNKSETESKFLAEYKLYRKVDILSEQVNELEKVLSEILTRIGDQPNEKIIYSREEVREMFTTNFQTLDNWKKANILVPFKLNGRVYYTAQTIKQASIQ